MESVKKVFFLILGLSLIIWSFSVVLERPAPAKYQHLSSEAVLKVASSTIPVEFANTEEARVQGLSGRESLKSGTGLFFIFDVPGNYAFWMKEMKFPIDIVWIDENLVVVGVEREVKPETYPELFHPPTKIKYVLELNSGDALALGIDIGLSVSLDR